MTTYGEIYNKLLQHYWGREGTLKDLAERAAKEYAYEFLQRYTEFLQKEGYIDTDATQEHPTAIDAFLKQERLKEQ